MTPSRFLSLVILFPMLLVACAPSDAQRWKDLNQFVEEQQIEKAQAALEALPPEELRSRGALVHFLWGTLWYLKSRQSGQAPDQDSLYKSERSFVRVLEFGGELATPARVNLEIVRRLLDPDRPPPQENSDSQDKKSDSQEKNEENDKKGKQNNQNDGSSSQEDVKGDAQDGPGEERDELQGGQGPAEQNERPDKKDLSAAVRPRERDPVDDLKDILASDEKRKEQKSLLIQGGIGAVEKDW